MIKKKQFSNRVMAGEASFALFVSIHVTFELKHSAEGACLLIVGPSHTVRASQNIDGLKY